MPFQRNYSQFNQILGQVYETKSMEKRKSFLPSHEMWHDVRQTPATWPCTHVWLFRVAYEHKHNYIVCACVSGMAPKRTEAIVDVSVATQETTMAKPFSPKNGYKHRIVLACHRPTYGHRLETLAITPIRHIMIIIIVSIVSPMRACGGLVKYSLPRMCTNVSCSNANLQRTRHIAFVGEEDDNPFEFARNTMLASSLSSLPPCTDNRFAFLQQTIFGTTDMQVAENLLCARQAPQIFQAFSKK